MLNAYTIRPAELASSTSRWQHQSELASAHTRATTIQGRIGLKIVRPENGLAFALTRWRTKICSAADRSIPDRTSTTIRMARVPRWEIGTATEAGIDKFLIVSGVRTRAFSEKGKRGFC